MLSKLFSLITRNILLSLICAVFLLDAGIFIAGLSGTEILQGLFINESADVGKLRSKLTTLGITHVVLWTIVPPTWFFLETFTLDEHLLPKGERAKDVSLKADYERLRLAQELAGRIWAAVLVTILFLVPK